MWILSVISRVKIHTRTDTAYKNVVLLFDLPSTDLLVTPSRIRTRHRSDG